MNIELLRPFDAGLAKAGEPICLYDGRPIAAYIAGPDADGDHVAWEDKVGGIIRFNHESTLRMAPIFWVEGKPVYKGDRLWHEVGKRWYMAVAPHPHPDESGIVVDNGNQYLAEYLHWEEPKEKRVGWLVLEKDDTETGTINVHGVRARPYLYTSEAQARNHALLDCTVVRVEFEL